MELTDFYVKLFYICCAYMFVGLIITLVTGLIASYRLVFEIIFWFSASTTIISAIVMIIYIILAGINIL